eukprot:g16913.t1
MAGEAGRGFAVVADEVQGLAERAASSTKQIETLVKTIQSDTNEAVASMEQTTAEVVRGAQLANDAGSALNEIQSTSENLAKLILAIATETQDQSTNANRIVGTMNVIQDISAETLEGTTASANAVGELAEQAQALRESISDFKLPDGSEEADEADIASALDVDSDADNFLAVADDESDDFGSDDADADSELIEDLTAEAEEVEQLLDEDFSEDETDVDESLEQEFASESDDEESLLGTDSDDLDSDDLDPDDFGEDFGEPADEQDLEDSEFGESEATEDDFESEMVDELASESDDADDDHFDESVFADLDLGDTEDSEPEAQENSEAADDEEDFSFSDEDFLTFDLDEDDDTRA